MCDLVVSGTLIPSQCLGVFEDTYVVETWNAQCVEPTWHMGLRFTPLENCSPETFLLRVFIERDRLFKRNKIYSEESPAQRRLHELLQQLCSNHLSGTLRLQTSSYQRFLSTISCPLHPSYRWICSVFTLTQLLLLHNRGVTVRRGL